MTPRLTVLLAWWNGWRPLYNVTHVNALSRMLRKHLNFPHRIVLLTDQDTTGLAGEVDEVLPLPDDPKGLALLRTVNCFRRLRFFDPEYTKQFGTDWVMSLDLDTLILGDITELLENAMQHPFGLWIVRGRWFDRSRNERPYNGAMYLIKVGAHADVWTSFDPVESPREILRRRWVGSDQCWIGVKAPGAPTFNMDNGVYFLGQYKIEKNKKLNPKPKIVNFAGMAKPWSKQCKFQAPDLFKEYMQWVA